MINVCCKTNFSKVENREFDLLAVGVGSFLLYSVHEGIRGIPLDPSDKSDALVPVSGTSLAVGIDFHAGKSLYNIFFSPSNAR